MDDAEFEAVFNAGYMAALRWAIALLDVDTASRFSLKQFGGSKAAWENRCKLSARLRNWEEGNYGC